MFTIKMTFAFNSEKKIVVIGAESKRIAEKQALASLSSKEVSKLRLFETEAYNG